jgi:ankyrin repeat protein
MLEQHPEPSTLVNILGDHKRTPLHLAAMRGYVELARILLAFGGDIHAKDTEPASVLDHALTNKQDDFVNLLLDIGVDETAILERNRDQLKKTKAIIAFRKKLKQSPPKERTRKSSWSFGRRSSK